MTLSLRSVVTTLRRHYGKPARPVSRDPFHLVLWEQVGYLGALSLIDGLEFD